MNLRKERVQKYLSHLGVGSRRQIEAWVSEGVVRINGRVAKPGDRVTAHCQININGRPLRLKPSTIKQRILLYNKPEGEICSRSDQAKRNTVFRQLPKKTGQRWVCVGRLDINTRGLLLFTNDGLLAHRLMHPSSGLEREYLCRVFGKVSDGDLNKLKSGVWIDRNEIAFKQIKKKQSEGRNSWYSVVVTEGRYREVRKLWQSINCQVSRLIRIRYGPIRLPRRLRQGQYQEMKSAEVMKLVKAVASQPTKKDG